MVHKVAAHGNIVLGLHLDRQRLEAEAKQICIDLIPDWKHLDCAAIKVSEISGGITNVLWKLQPSCASLEPVVLRIFGKQTDKIIDRDHEKRVLGPLNLAGFGAQVLATFQNGRIEEFLRMRPLNPQEMTDSSMASSIAKRLRQFHDVNLGPVPESQLFKTMKTWLRQAQELNFEEDDGKAAAYRRIDFVTLQAALAKIDALSRGLQPRTCFSHNDLLSGNILIPEQADPLKSCEEVQFIDFEYSGYAYNTFDIANHFCEYAGFACDYSRFPNDGHIAHFMSCYLYGRPILSKEEEQQVERSVVECKLLALASHQFWGTWAILQAKFSPIDFDYMGYSNLRWTEYFKREKEFAEQAEDWLRANGK